MKQTAIEWLEIQLFKKKGKFNKSDIEQAKAMEKEQMIEARATAPLLASIDKEDYIKEAEQYYNETYEKR